MATVSEWGARALERHCVHCSRETQGTAYAGRDYLRGLQLLRGGEAMSMARRVEPFFWSDADMISVRLCEDCRALLKLRAVAGGPATSFPVAVKA